MKRAARSRTAILKGSRLRRFLLGLLGVAIFATLGGLAIYGAQNAPERTQGQWTKLTGTPGLGSFDLGEHYTNLITKFLLRVSRFLVET